MTGCHRKTRTAESSKVSLLLGCLFGCLITLWVIKSSTLEVPSVRTTVKTKQEWSERRGGPLSGIYLHGNMKGKSSTESRLKGGVVFIEACHCQRSPGWFTDFLIHFVCDLGFAC